MFAASHQFLSETTMQSSLTSWVVSFLILCLSSFSSLASDNVGASQRFAERLAAAAQSTYTIDSYQVEEDKNVCPTHGERQGYGENVQSARCNKNAWTLDEYPLTRLLAALYNSPFPFYATLDSHTDTHHLHLHLRKHQPQDALYLAFCDLRN